jgi:hypothetical protein
MKPKSFLTPLLTGTVVNYSPAFPVEAIQNERSLKMPLNIEAIQNERLRAVPFQIEAVKTLRYAIPFAIESDGEPEGSFGQTFNIYRSGEPHLTHFFDIIKGQPDTNPIEMLFDIYEGANALDFTFDIFSESLRALFSDDVQRPIADVEIKS